VVGRGVGGKAVVDQAQGGRAGLLDQVDLDGAQTSSTGAAIVTW
jgi:hypothetical protein